MGKKILTFLRMKNKILDLPNDFASQQTILMNAILTPDKFFLKKSCTILKKTIRFLSRGKCDINTSQRVTYIYFTSSVNFY